MELSFFIYLSIFMFITGIIGVITKRNALILFLCVELLLNSANLLFVAFARSWENETGLIWVLFVLFIAAVETSVGLAIIINLFRTKEVVDVDQFNSLKG